VVAQVDQCGEEPVEQPPLRVSADQGAVGGVGEQPPPPPLPRRRAQQIGDDAAGQAVGWSEWELGNRAQGHSGTLRPCSSRPRRPRQDQRGAIAFVILQYVIR